MHSGEEGQRWEVLVSLTLNMDLCIQAHRGAGGVAPVRIDQVLNGEVKLWLKYGQGTWADPRAPVHRYS